MFKYDSTGLVVQVKLALHLISNRLHFRDGSHISSSAVVAKKPQVAFHSFRGMPRTYSTVTPGLAAFLSDTQGCWTQKQHLLK